EEPHPNAVFRIGRNRRGVWHLRAWNIFSNAEIRDADQPLRLPEGDCPDVVLPILCHRPDRSEWTAVGTVDEAESAALVDRQSVAAAAPQATAMIFDARCHPPARQAVSRLE